jgi:hypothetical protein
MDTVMLLRDALAPELEKLTELAKGVVPQLDGASIGSLLTLYGIEIGLTAGAVSAEHMAAYLRFIAEALEAGTGSLPTLSRIPPDEAGEPAF